MRLPLNRNISLTHSPFPVSCQYRCLFFHSRAHFIKQLQNCKDLISAISIHPFVVKSGFLNDTISTTHLINTYARLHRIKDAHKLFNEMPQPNIVSWTSIMRGYLDEGQPRMTIQLFQKMQESPVFPNEFTFSTVIKACSVLTNLEIGRRIHAFIEIMGWQSNVVVCNSLIDMYGKCSDINEARLIFDSMYGRDIVSWTSMITAYVQNAQGHHALQLFREFNHVRLDSPNHYMLSGAISACTSLGSLGSGKITHGVVIRLGYDANVVISNALVDMYGKCGFVDYSNKVFRRIPNPSIITFYSMIFSATKCGDGILSLEIFQEMIDRRIKPDDVTFAMILHTCASLGILDFGKITHGMVIRLGYDVDEVISSALVDMYGKCGCFIYSNKVFMRISNPSVIDFTSMIVSAARNGNGILSLQLFQEMIDRRIKPDDVTFMGILHACSHSRLIDKGLELFTTMKEEYGVVPHVRHYRCVVDMLGRWGHLEEAYKLVISAQDEHDEVALLWKTFLSACRIHGRVDMALEAKRHLIKSNQQEACIYMTLLGTYVGVGDWESAYTLQLEIDNAGLPPREPGCSWIEIK